MSVMSEDEMDTDDEDRSASVMEDHVHQRVNAEVTRLRRLSDAKMEVCRQSHQTRSL